MMSSAAVTRGRTVLSHPAVAALVAAVAVRLPYARGPLESDAGTILAMGEGWLRGALPYRDVLDPRGPVVAEAGVLLALLPGWAPLLRLLLLAVVVGSSWQIAQLVTRHTTLAAGWVAAVLYAIAASSPVLNGETLTTGALALPLIVALLDLADRASTAPVQRGAIGYSAGAGATAVLLVGVDPVMAGFGIVAVVVLTRATHRMRALGAAAGGALVAGVAVGLPFLMTGAAGNLRYVVLNDHVTQVGYAFDNLRALPGNPIQGYLTTFPAFFTLGAAVGFGAVALATPTTRRVGLLGLGSTVAGWVVARSNGSSAAEEFLPMVPGLVLLLSAGCAALAADLRTGATYALALPLLVVGGELAVDPARQAIRTVPEHRTGQGAAPELGAQRDVAEAVRELTGDGDTIHVAPTEPSNSGQAIYWLAGRRPAARRLTPGARIPAAYAEVARDVARARPAAVVILPGAQVTDLIPALEAGGYVEARRVGTPPNESLIYVRPDRAPKRADR